MADDTKKCGLTGAKVRWNPETIEAAIRERARDTIEAVLEEELEAALGAGLSARVDDAILGVYLAGGNSRRIRGALAPLLSREPLLKDAVSRLVGRLAEEFATWWQRDLADDQIRDLLLDGWYPKIRLGRRRVRVPVLVTMGVRGTGDRVIADMRLVGGESTAAWREVVQQRQARHLGTPVLAVIDGTPGLATALREAWPRASRRRATSCSRSSASRGRSGRRCGRRTPWSASTRSAAGARRRRRVCPARTRPCCSSSGCCAPVTSGSGRSTGGRKWRRSPPPPWRPERRRSGAGCRVHTVPPLDRHDRLPTGNCPLVDCNH